MTTKNTIASLHTAPHFDAIILSTGRANAPPAENSSAGPRGDAAWVWVPWVAFDEDAVWVWVSWVASDEHDVGGF